MVIKQQFILDVINVAIIVEWIENAFYIRPSLAFRRSIRIKWSLVTLTMSSTSFVQKEIY